MAAQPERTPGVLARQLEASTRRYLAETAELPATHPVPFFGGVTIELAAQSALLLDEFVVHGLDVARSIGRRWPIDPAHARLIIAAVTALLPRDVDRAAAAGLTATYQVHLRGGPSFQVRFDRDTATVGPPHAGAADCRLTVDPVTFLLVVYGRRSQWPGILRGQLRLGSPTLAGPAIPAPVRAALTSQATFRASTQALARQPGAWSWTRPFPAHNAARPHRSPSGSSWAAPPARSSTSRPAVSTTTG